MHQHCGQSGQHPAHDWTVIGRRRPAYCPGTPEFSVDKVFPSTETITDGSYRVGDHIRIDAKVTRLTPGGTLVLVINGVAGERTMPKTVVAGLIRRDKTPSQVLWEELHPSISWDSQLQATKDQFERVARKIREMRG